MNSEAGGCAGYDWLHLRTPKQTLPPTSWPYFILNTLSLFLLFSSLSLTQTFSDSKFFASSAPSVYMRRSTHMHTQLCRAHHTPTRIEVCLGVEFTSGFTWLSAALQSGAVILRSGSGIFMRSQAPDTLNTSLLLGSVVYQILS